MFISLLSIMTLFANLEGAFADCKDGKILNSKLTIKQVEEVLTRHNFYRDKIAGGGQISYQPPAQYMMEMKWDNTLAKLAQDSTDKCVLAHKYFDETTKRVPHGQNLGIVRHYDHNDSSVCKPDDPISILDSWFEEVELYHFSNISRPDSYHYSQMVWANTSLVGCGYTAFENNKRANCFLWCNYHPVGNVEGEFPYIQGIKNCELNNLRNSKKYRNLCVQRKRRNEPLPKGVKLWQL